MIIKLFVACFLAHPMDMVCLLCWSNFALVSCLILSLSMSLKIKFEQLIAGNACAGCKPRRLSTSNEDLNPGQFWTGF